MTDHPVRTNTHVFMSVGCPHGTYGAFTIDNGKHICDVCEEDITHEFLAIYEVLKKALKK